MKALRFKNIALTTLVVANLFACKDNGGGADPDILTGATITAEMGSDLSHQAYINLSAGTTTNVEVNTWELAFENSGSAIRTNSAKKVGITTPEETSFAEVSSDDGLVYSYDSEDGELSGTALDGWSVNQPYIIDLGVDENGNALGKKKFVITAQSSSSISITFAELDGSTETTASITPDSDANFTFFSLINNETVTVEPTDWDLLLTAVSVRTGAPCAALGGGAIPGVNCDVYRIAAAALTNSYEDVEVAVDDPFSDMEASDDPDAEKNQQTIESSNYSTLTETDFYALGHSHEADAIGRSWLHILAPHSSGVYKVYDFITYLVNDPNDNMYKLRFLAYKGGDNAENGNPTFEYELISE